MPFTKENAASFGALGAQAQKAARLAHAQRLRNAADGTEFQAETLARVREVLTDTLIKLAASKDAKDRELLARAASHMAELERRLAGRPLPGSRRPANQDQAPPHPGLPEPT